MEGANSPAFVGSSGRWAWEAWGLALSLSPSNTGCLRWLYVSGEEIGGKSIFWKMTTTVDWGKEG